MKKYIQQKLIGLKQQCVKQKPGGFMCKNIRVGLLSFIVAVALPFCGLSNASVYAEEEISYVYDNDGRVVSATYPDGTVVTYHYDSNGNLIETETAAGSRYNSEESREVSTEDDALVDVESPASPSPTSVDVTGNDPVKKQTTSVSVDSTESESDHQEVGEKTVADESTTEEQDDADKEDHKGIGKWIALVALGGTAVVAAAGVSIAVVGNKKVHR